MAAQILVAYASKTGSTAEIAQAVGKELQSAGYSTDVAEMKAVSSLADYHAVVIGGPLYMGKVVGDVGKFVGRHHEVLSKIPVAAFTVGITPVSKDPVQIGNAMKLLHSSLAPLQPVSESVFAGRVDPKKLSFIQRKMTEMAKSPVGDFRDWEAIARWARELPAKMGL
jgi:menaquinone-dependent protoporphyrinogen oxidase